MKINEKELSNYLDLELKSAIKEIEDLNNKVYRGNKQIKLETISFLCGKRDFIRNLQNKLF